MRSAPTRAFRVALAPAALLIVFASVARSQETARTAGHGPAKQMQPADLKAWKSIRQSVLSNDGKWLAYVLAPNEGEEKSKRFPASGSANIPA